METTQFFAPAEFKLAGGAAGEAMLFSGLAAAFNNIDSYGDVIVPGAFASWLEDVKAGRQPWPAMLAQHGGFGMGADDLTPIGVWTSFAEQADGLRAEGKLADTPRGREMYALLKMSPRPAISGMSIGYIPKDFEPRSKPEDPRRKLKRVDVIEVSLVTFPANRRARVSDVKDGRPTSVRALEDYLREAGFSAREAKRLASGGWPALLSHQDDSSELEELVNLAKRNTALLRAA